MSEDNVAIRLKGFIDQSGLTSSQFADQCGIPRPSLSQILSGRNKKISDVIVGMIHQAFPDLNILWLLFGEGDMTVRKPSPDGATNGDQVSPASGDVDSDINRIETLYEGAEGSGREGMASAPTAKMPIKQQMLLERRIAELEAELKQLKRNPRKVAQITVYYDDSTFETFIPSQRK